MSTQGVSCQGISVQVDGWTGSVSLTDGVDTVTVAPTDPASPLGVWFDLFVATQAQWGSTTWGVTEDGYLTMTFGGSLTLSFAAGTTEARLGFSGGQSGGTVTGDTYPEYSLLGPPALYAEDWIDCSEAGVRTHRGHLSKRLPYHISSPALVLTPLTGAETQRMVAAWDVMTGDIDVYDDGLTTVKPQAFRFRRIAPEGVHELTVECSR